MSLPESGKISLKDIQTQFGGTDPISMSEYYRGGALLPANASQNVPSSGPISLSNFYSKDIMYEIIGGGGSGGDSWNNNHSAVAAIATQNGGDSKITGAFVSITAAGGAGGINGIGPNVNYGSPGYASFYGPGGVAGGEDGAGGDAPSSSYGAGGGGAGGDNGSIFSEGGPRGEGGHASTILTGSFNSIKGTVLNVVIGAGGLPYGGGNHPGGKGASGICKITKDGVTTTFNSSGTYIV